MLHRLCIVVTRRSFVAMTFCCTCEMATYSSEPKDEREGHSTSYLPFPPPPPSLSLSLSLLTYYTHSVWWSNILRQFDRAISSDLLSISLSHSAPTIMPNFSSLSGKNYPSLSIFTSYPFENFRSPICSYLCACILHRYFSEVGQVM